METFQQYIDGSNLFAICKMMFGVFPFQHYLTLKAPITTIVVFFVFCRLL